MATLKFIPDPVMGEFLAYFHKRPAKEQDLAAAIAEHVQSESPDPRIKRAYEQLTHGESR